MEGKPSALRKPNGIPLKEELTVEPGMRGSVFKQKL